MVVESIVFKTVLFSDNFVPTTKMKYYKKFKKAAWLVSNCKTHNRRENYVKEIKKYFPVDVYGYCGNLTYDNDNNKDCFDYISDNYMFYLAFENSNCKGDLVNKTGPDPCNM